MRKLVWVLLVLVAVGAIALVAWRLWRPSDPPRWKMHPIAALRHE
jgi:hypothetical protein